MTELADGAIHCPKCGSMVEGDSVGVQKSDFAKKKKGGGARGFCRIFFSAIFCVILFGGIYANTLLGGFRYGFCDGRLGTFLEDSGFYDAIDDAEESGKLDSSAIAGYLYENIDAGTLRLYGVTQSGLADILDENGVGGHIEGRGISDTIRQVLGMRENPGANFIFIALIVFNVLIAACLFLFNQRKIRLGFIFTGCPLAVNGIIFFLIGLFPVRQMAMGTGVYGALTDISLYVLTRVTRLSLVCGACYLAVGIVFLILFGVMKSGKLKSKAIN